MHTIKWFPEGTSQTEIDDETVWAFRVSLPNTQLKWFHSFPTCSDNVSSATLTTHLVLSAPYFHRSLASMCLLQQCQVMDGGYGQKVRLTPGSQMSWTVMMDARSLRSSQKQPVRKVKGGVKCVRRDILHSTYHEPRCCWLQFAYCSAFKIVENCSDATENIVEPKIHRRAWREYLVSRKWAN